MLGFALAYYLPSHFWHPDNPMVQWLLWALQFEVHFEDPRDGKMELRVLGLSLSVGWTTPGYHKDMRNQAEKLTDIIGKMGEIVANALAKADENAKNSGENTEKASENVENATKTDENEQKPKKVLYQGIEHDGSGVAQVHVRSKEARLWLTEDMDWYMGEFSRGAKLLVSDDDHVNYNDRSFTLPDYENANIFEINDVIVFGNAKKYLAARISGYQQSPEGERTYFYKKV